MRMSDTCRKKNNSLDIIILNNNNNNNSENLLTPRRTDGTGKNRDASVSARLDTILHVYVYVLL